jgi:hypothetical protein
MRRPVLLAVVALLCPAAAHAEGERYELGRRLRAFEIAYDVQTNAAAFKRVVAPLQAAMRSFFLFQFGEAGWGLDSARFALASDEEPDADVRWAESLSLRPARRFLDASSESVSFTLAPFYKAGDHKPDQARLRVVFVRPRRQTAER